MIITPQNTTASLVVNFFSDSLVYTGQGGSEWTADVTDTCVGGNPTRLTIGGLWFIGGGTAAGTRLSEGDKSVSGITSRYRFIR